MKNNYSLHRSNEHGDGVYFFSPLGVIGDVPLDISGPANPNENLDSHLKLASKALNRPVELLRQDLDGGETIIWPK